MQPTNFHNENNTNHWGADRAAAQAKQDRLDQLGEKIADLEMAQTNPAELSALYKELFRIDALTPSEFQAEVDAAMADHYDDVADARTQALFGQSL